MSWKRLKNAPFAATNITNRLTMQVSKEAFRSSVFLYLSRDETCHVSQTRLIRFSYYVFRDDQVKAIERFSGLACQVAIIFQVSVDNSL